MQGQSLKKMSIEECAGHAFGISIGNLFLGFFGMVWIVLGLMAVGNTNLPVLTLSTDKISPLTLTLLSGFLALLVAASIYTMRRTYGLLDRSDANKATQKKINRRFGLVNFVQWGLIFAAVSGLSHLGLSDWIMPTIILIVGIHFFPLARLFENRAHYITGAVIVAWAIVYPIVFSPGKGDPIGAWGMGAILWASAAFMCRRAFLLLRRIPAAGPEKGTIPNGAQA